MISSSNVSSHAGLLYYWRVHLGLLLGTAVATTALTGALLVGDSMRGSLRDLALERLGQIDYALLAAHFFRSELPKTLSENPPWVALSRGMSFPRKRESSGGDLNTRDDTQSFQSAPMGHAPAILLNGSARHATTQALAAGVQIQGIDARFAALFPESGPALRDALKPTPGQPFPSLIVNAALQRALDIELGDAVLLSLERPSSTYRESLFGRRATDDLVSTLRVVLTGVLPDSGAGRFGLRPHQHLPLNAYLDLQTLQRTLDQQDRVNALLIAAPNSQHQDLQRTLDQHLSLADRKLDLALHSNYIELTSTRFVLDDSIRVAALASAAALQLKTATFSTYLANAIEKPSENPPWVALSRARAGGPSFPRKRESSGRGLNTRDGTQSFQTASESNSRQVPYSTVTGLDDPTGLYLTGGQPAPPLADDAIYLDAWTAQELAATPGDSISLTYYVVGPRHELRTEQAHFRLQGIVQMRGLAIDPTLTPKYPGLQEEGDISAWDAPFPIDMGQIRPQDEAYWDQYGAAPKAFVAVQTGQRLWSSRHGTLTAIRFYPSSPTHYQPTNSELVKPSSELVKLRTAIHQDLLDRLSPASAGFSLRPVRQEALLASTGATDFSGLFIGFSLFLIAAAALLVVLLCKFGLEQRAHEAGLLLATGYPLAAVGRRFLGEGIALAALGALLGLAGAPLYAYLMLVGLHTLWLEAIGTPFLQLHISWLSLGIGYLSTLLLVSLALWRTVQRFHRMPIRALLAGALDTAPRLPRRRNAVLAALGLVLALTLSILAGMADAATAAALFLGSGTAALLALLALFSVWLHAPTSGRLNSSLGLGLLNSTRKPSRSTLCTSLVACATFVIVAAGAHRQVEWSDDPGTGGFSLVAEAEIPLHQDLNSADGRFELGLSTDLGTAHFFPFRVLPGDDVSCLNLYIPQTPRVLGAPAEFVQRGGLPFRQTLSLTPDERTNPWRLLQRDLGSGVIPAIGDFNSAQWILHKHLGDDIPIAEGLSLRLVGLLDGSLFQSELLIAEDRFAAHFPEREGYGYFLVETAQPAAVAAVLEKELASYGLDATLSAERLRGYRAVENTYLATFQTLGLLGLLLGTLGLGILILRNVLERSGELAALSACGFRRARLGTMLLYEHGFLLLAGEGIGSVAALIAVAPRLFAPTPLPWVSLIISLGLVFAAGLLACAVASHLALRRPLLAALKAEG